MPFVDQKSFKVTKEHLKMSWSGGKNGKFFRCYICGYKFMLNDYCRFVMAGQRGYINFLVCEKCDCVDILDKWIKINEEVKQKYWWILK